MSEIRYGDIKTSEPVDLINPEKLYCYMEFSKDDIDDGRISDGYVRECLKDAFEYEIEKKFGTNRYYDERFEVKKEYVVDKDFKYYRFSSVIKL